ncbi:hotdog fold thioesterase [Acerihabitans arboris]|uniref:Hotdog fold thioesterase n=1 Tax=Acerihabitans arboris TaxID=2691583 RepID=A0A845SIH9_9GAMM|nr:hotdog fold thioesterase [Acerihabitans arboris]NDL63077.1 hotdog fold thioesterase [Acerihabitans arboris]
MIWNRPTSLDALNRQSEGTLAAHLGMVYTRIGDDELEAVMPVDERTRQPFGLLHGGASVALAETLGSVAGYLCTKNEEMVVGLDINANHLRPVTDGEVRAVCRSIHLGNTHQVWDIRIYDGRGKISCICRLTTVVLRPAA